MKYLTLLPLVGVLAACTALPPEPITHSKEFVPVYPVQVAQPAAATGSIYNGRVNESFFSGGRSFQVGDLITVILAEESKATRNQKGEVSRTSSTDIMPPGLKGLMGDIGFASSGAKLGATTSANGNGAATQEGALTGSVTVAVVAIMSNGNLILRGEKQLALTEGSEIIQVAGVIRPDDIAPNNTVLSRRLANAQITYRGSGDMAAATRPGWGSSALLKLWPF
jgi:flagellar L-ring protein precursor FlgH